MDKYLRPERLEVDPTQADASLQWTHWYSTFNNFVTATKLTDDGSKLHLLINFVSCNVFTYINEAKTFTEAITILQNLYVKPKNIIYARHCLATRKQGSDETIDVYYQALTLLSKDCDFHSVSAVENRSDCVLDSFISGLISTTIRQRLLENNTLTLNDAYKQALSLESAQKHSSTYTSPLSELNAAVSENKLTHHVMKGSDCSSDGHQNTLAVSFSKWSGRKCFFCGSTPVHSRAVCPAKGATCNKCGKIGHYQKVCRSASKVLSASLDNKGTIVSAAAPACVRKAVKSIKIDGNLCEALIDTGSSQSFINFTKVQILQLSMTPQSGQVSMASTSLTSQILGYCLLDFKMDGNVYRGVKLLVMKELCADVILGHDILQNHSFVELEFGGPMERLKVCSLTVATVTPVSLFSNLVEGTKPIAVKSRLHFYSPTDLDFIKSETNRLLNEGIIEPSKSPWRAQALVVSNSNQKKRMVIDYSQTINQYTLPDAYPLPRIDDIVQKVSKFSVFSCIDLQSAYHQVPINVEERHYTAFESCGRLYQFTRIPFGVTNGVAAFQRVIDDIIETENLTGTYAYLDDVTICGKDLDEHDENLSKFMKAVKKYNLVLNENKCSFRKSSINILGYSISNKTIKPDKERIKSLLELPAPNNSTSLQRVLGLFSYYSKWIQNYSNKIRTLVQCKSFPLSLEALEAFKLLKNDLASAMLSAIDESIPFSVETDASQFAISATLSQQGRPVAFFSRTLSNTEQRHPIIEKEAYAVVEALRKWRQFLIPRHFHLVTDQKSVSFMFDNHRTTKIKNEKIMRWRIELSPYKYDIVYRPGNQNLAADALSRISASIQTQSLLDWHARLCHPGVTRMFHYVRAKNLPFTLEEVKSMTSSCKVCARVKPRFYKKETGHLIKATSPWERLNIDFKGPLPSTTNNRYILTVVDEYSRFPFALPCPDISSSTVRKHLCSLFSLFGLPAYVHSDQGTAFMSDDLKTFLHDLGVATSRTTPYNPRGNGQCERYNGIIWNTINLALDSRGLEPKNWEIVLNDALHSLRSLLCTATNATPHERMFLHSRRSTSGISLPAWLLNPGPILLRRQNRKSKYDSLVEEVDLVEANPEYSQIRFSDGRNATVSTRHLAPLGDSVDARSAVTHPPTLRSIEQFTEKINVQPELPTQVNVDENTQWTDERPEQSPPLEVDENTVRSPTNETLDKINHDELRRSTRPKRPPTYLADYLK